MALQILTSSDKKLDYYDNISSIRNILSGMIVNNTDIRELFISYLETIFTNNEIDIIIANKEECSNNFIITLKNLMDYNKILCSRYMIYDIINNTLINFLNDNVVLNYLNNITPIESEPMQFFAQMTQSYDTISKLSFISSIYTLSMSIGCFILTI